MPIPFRLSLSAPFPFLMWLASRFAKKNRVKSSEYKKRHFKLPRKLSFTKYGARYTVLLLIIGVAAINTGNNLLYLVVAMMMSLIVISGIMSESSIRDLYITRQLPKHIFAGRPATVQWTAKNEKKHIPSFSIFIEEISDKGIKTDGCYFIKAAAKTTIEKTASYIFPKRGVYNLIGFKISTRFPFGLFLKSREIDSPYEVIVYPQIKSIKSIARSIEPLALHGETPEKIKGTGTQIYNIRDYAAGDDSRLIHWKSSAKAARLMSKEFEREKKKRLIIHLNNIEPEKPPDNFQGEFESIIEDAASLASHFIKKGFSVGIKTIGPEGYEDVPCRTGAAHLYRILKTLAIIQPVKTKDAKGTFGLKVIGM
ncbi:MAG: DUF58 domain-containing protein [Deltaproteobacteria bacterium]|nr:DUF58 domain-containing protein [Deltaproteobacteria bacterium]